jgi:PAS domain S-box-containing protein
MGMELENARTLDALKFLHRESRELCWDLFDEAPFAYVLERPDSKFVRANRAAMQILGVKAEEVEGTYGKSFVPERAEAQRRLRQALEAMGRGVETDGLVMELQRKDNGNPVWIRHWSRPHASGTYTRTMFIDITKNMLKDEKHARLRAENAYLQEEIRNEYNFDEIVGNSPALLEALQQIDLIAAANSTALILGETGTGKELIARAIHDRSPRRVHPLVKVNCGALSPGLVESELFGHVKGAFTGALAHRDGRFKLANGGTIFLDEVGELPMDTQVKLLRVLQEQEFESIGSSKTVKVDVRIIAATNRDLATAVREGKFRSDLYYRLNVVPIRVPPLRERIVDVPLLATFFLERFAKKFNKPVKHFAGDDMRRMMAYPWPGNIRELENVIERAMVLSQGTVLALAVDFGPTSAEIGTVEDQTPGVAPVFWASAAAPGTSLEEVERRHIKRVLQRQNWTVEGEQGAAKVLQLNPSTLRSRMQRLGIKRPGRKV